MQCVSPPLDGHGPPEDKSAMDTSTRRRRGLLIIVSDLFTDLSYIAAVPSLTTLGWALLTPPAFLNAAFIVTMLLAYRRWVPRGAR